MAAFVTISLYNDLPRYPGLIADKPDSVLKRTSTGTGTTAPIAAGTAWLRLATDADLLFAIQSSTATATTNAELLPSGAIEAREVATDTHVVLFTQ